MSVVLNQKLLADDAFWAGKPALLPKYDRAMPLGAVCFSPGRMGFGHFGDIVQDLLNQGEDAGTIAGIETYSRDYRDSLLGNDLLVTQIIYGGEKGQAVAKIQGAFSAALYLEADPSSADWLRLLELARDPRVRYATINAPEIVYGMKYKGGEFAEPSSPKVIADMENGTVVSDPAKWTRFALERFNAGLKFAFVSCTNFSKNGFFTGAVVRTMGHAWEKNGFAPKGFYAYLADPAQVGFPNTMVDRIAVSPDNAVAELMEKLGISSNIVVTEENRYWAIEDVFPAGRPAFEKAAGVFMCRDFEEVKKYEDMKLRILNMSHTVIASLGVLLGYRGQYGIYNAMQEPAIVGIITKIIDIVKNIIEKPAGIRVEDFIRDTFTRLNNPNIPDDPMRIALNASTKIVPRLMDTYWEAEEKGYRREALSVILLPVAGFLRYTTAVDDKAVAYKPEDDPIREVLLSCGAAAKAGAEVKTAFGPLLSDPQIMGRNLFEHTAVLDELMGYVNAMLAGEGSVRRVVEGI